MVVKTPLASLSPTQTNKHHAVGARKPTTHKDMLEFSPPPPTPPPPTTPHEATPPSPAVELPSPTPSAHPPALELPTVDEKLLLPPLEHRKSIAITALVQLGFTYGALGAHPSAFSLLAYAGCLAVFAHAILSVALSRPPPRAPLTDSDVLWLTLPILAAVNYCLDLLDRIRCGDAKLALKCGGSLWLASHATASLSTYSLVWLGAVGASARSWAWPMAARAYSHPAVQPHVSAARAAIVAMTQAHLHKVEQMLPASRRLEFKWYGQIAASFGALIVISRLSWANLLLGSTALMLVAKLCFIGDDEVKQDELSRTFNRNLQRVGHAGSHIGKKARRFSMAALNSIGQKVPPSPLKAKAL